MCLLCSQQKARRWQRRGIRGYIYANSGILYQQIVTKKSQAIYVNVHRLHSHREHVEMLGMMLTSFVCVCVIFFCTWWLWVVLSSDICQRGWKQNVETSQIHVNYRSSTIIVVKMGAIFKKKLKCALLIFFTSGKHHVKWNRSLQWLPLLKTCVLKQNEQSAHSKKYCSNLVHANLDIKYLTLTRHHFPQVHEICM